ncbi:glycosyltransferase [Sphingomonas sp.]|uniref:glycosyltransferase n=1 Tax=Sphingomonas sp. TaxID=28214 RepID=UPI003CC623D4
MGQGVTPLGRTIVVISDLVEGRTPPDWVVEAEPGPPAPVDTGSLRPALAVTGGYLERLPLACVKVGLADRAEIWHHLAPGLPHRYKVEHDLLVRRAFPLDDARVEGGPPVRSGAMRRHFERLGAPALLVVLGLGVEAGVLDACAGSTILYNSIDHPALRMPDDVARRFDLVLTGAPWQSDEVERRVPGMRTAVLPIGPEFAAVDLFRPLDEPKTHDLIYVAAAQPYKRHDILFDALAQLPRSVSALCVFGYGELADAYRERIAREGLNIECAGPPGVPFAEVNRLMNRARIGVVCGRDDGAPAILTEYMLAGLPVLANAELSCGRQYILPETGALATADGFAQGIVDLLARAPAMDPRAEVLARWAWPHSVARLKTLILNNLDQTP